MKGRIVVGLSLILLVLPAWPLSLPSIALAASGMRAPVQGGTTIYKAAFARDHLKGWTISAGPVWHVTRKGIATFDGSGSGMVLAPFSTRGMHDFAVQASIRAVGTSSDSAYGVLVRSRGLSGDLAFSGVEGGMSLSSSTPEFSRPLLSWNEDRIGGANVTLNTGYNTYRVDVHGADFTLTVDGHQIVQFTIADYGDASQYAQVGLWSQKQKMQVK